MKRIITENPQGMIQHMNNFVFVKNNEVYVRIDDKEISLVEYIRKMDKELYGIEHDGEMCNAEYFGECMDDDRLTCIMYHALVGFATVRNYLKCYEDANVEETIARNLVAWDTSKDKKESLLPEVYVKNRWVYKELTGEEYNFSKACKKYNIEY